MSSGGEAGMKNSKRIGLLSSVTSPLLAPTISAMHRAGLFDLVLILDEKRDSEKDLLIWQERTGGYFEKQPDITPSLYAFTQHMPPSYFVANHNSAVSLELIRSLDIGVLVNAGTPRKLKSDILHAVPHGAINVHPGILPKYRGASCVEWAIYNGDQVGNTAHFMTEGYDEGPIIAVEGYHFPKDADYQLIRCLTYANGFHLAAKTVAKVLEQGIIADQLEPQKLGQYWKPIPPEKMTDVLRKIDARDYPYLTL